MSSQNKCRELIETRIEEGRELNGIFTRSLGVAHLYPVDTMCISTWLTKSLRVFDYIGTDGIDGKIYSIFETHLTDIDNITLNKFKDLLGYLQGILETLDLKELKK